MKSINLPVLIKNRELISPGIWNDNDYTADELQSAFTRTDWSNKDVISIWANHDDRNADAFLGYVRNIKFTPNSKLVGDLELWDERMIIKVKNAKAKFGVSVKIKGEEDKKTGKMKNFTFENFSIVTAPACKTAYINLKKDGVVATYLIPKEWIHNQSVKKEVNKMKELQEEEKEKVEEEEKVEEKPEESVEESKEEKEELIEESKEEPKEELSKEMIKSMIKEILKEESALKEAEPKEEVKEELEEEKPEEEEPKEEEKELSVSDKKYAELETKFEKVQKRLSEIEEKLNTPKSKTVKALSSEGNQEEYSDEKFVKYLRDLQSPVKI